MLTKILDTLPVGVVLVDEAMQVLSLNNKLVQLCGYSQQEAAGVGVDFILRARINSASFSSLGVLIKEASVLEEQIYKEGTILNRSRNIISVGFTINNIALDPKKVMIVVEEIKTAENKEYVPFATRMVGSSPQMDKVFERMTVFARTDASVLITGETGCGKDLLAEELHKSSERVKYPFIKVNCGALPADLLESELFGHKRGAFTGAVNDHQGMFRMAHKGTLFLTEIGDLSLPLQVKLLSVLDDRKFFPVGSSTEVSVDVRLIAATHRNLKREVAVGRFREDLFFRLNVLHLEIPPLRERKDDLRLLIEHFLQQMIVRFSRKKERIKGVESETLSLLYKYHWPGNIRELRNVMEYAVHMCSGVLIMPEDLPDYLLTENKQQIYEEDESVEKSCRQCLTNVVPEKSSSQNVHLLSTKTSLHSTWKEAEKRRIIEALQRTGGRKTRAAELLNMGRTTLWRKMRRYGLDG